jgi:hypothetical protein
MDFLTSPLTSNDGGLKEGCSWAVLQLSLSECSSEWRRMELGSHQVRSQHAEAEGALRSGGLKKRLSGAVLQLSVDNEARISLGSEPTPAS